MSGNEATARIKINRLLEAAGWRFFPDGDRPANIRLEAGVTLKPADAVSLHLGTAHEFIRLHL